MYNNVFIFHPSKLYNKNNKKQILLNLLFKFFAKKLNFYLLRKRKITIIFQYWDSFYENKLFTL